MWKYSVGYVWKHACKSWLIPPNTVKLRRIMGAKTLACHACVGIEVGGSSVVLTPRCHRVQDCQGFKAPHCYWSHTEHYIHWQNCIQWVFLPVNWNHSPSVPMCRGFACTDKCCFPKNFPVITYSSWYVNLIAQQNNVSLISNESHRVLYEVMS